MFLNDYKIQDERRIFYTDNSKAEIIHNQEVSQSDINMLARCLLPEIQKFFESEEGKKEFEEWKLKQNIK